MRAQFIAGRTVDTVVEHAGYTPPPQHCVCCQRLWKAHERARPPPCHGQNGPSHPDSRILTLEGVITGARTSQPVHEPRQRNSFQRDPGSIEQKKCLRQQEQVRGRRAEDASESLHWWQEYRDGILIGIAGGTSIGILRRIFRGVRGGLWYAPCHYEASLHPTNAYGHACPRRHQASVGSVS